MIQMNSTPSKEGDIQASQNAVSPLYWDDIDIGEKFITRGRTVTEADVVNFAALSGDYNSIHVDAVSSARSHHGQRIAHGLLVMSVISGLNTRLVMNQRMEPSLIAILNIECRFPKPTFIGDTLHAEISLEDKRLTSDARRGILVFQRLGVNQRQETVMHSVFKLLVATRLAEPAESV